MRRLSVIIVTYNSEKHIYDCLSSLFKYNDIGEGLEIIVVDNCSKEYEKMYQCLKKKYRNRVVVISNIQNGGYGQGNNIGISLSQAPYIMIMNPDVRLCEPVFNKVLKEFDGNKKCVMYGFTQRNSNGRLGRSTAWSTRLHPYIAEPLRFLTGITNLYFPKYMYICGACFFLRKSSFEKIGLYDENIFMYGEEMDIHSRLLKEKGSQIIYNKTISYLHLHESVIDYSKESFGWMKNDLNSLLYINKRDGISECKTLNYAVKRANISILKERLLLLICKGDKAKINYFLLWKQMLLNPSFVNSICKF